MTHVRKSQIQLKGIFYLLNRTHLVALRIKGMKFSKLVKFNKWYLLNITMRNNFLHMLISLYYNYKEVNHEKGETAETGGL